ncbi:MAG: polysaccharide deacetylase family protein [Clostridia bacterium]|nr:polysaccharide deacetylase family protein [Clostridia bacterium]
MNNRWVLLLLLLGLLAVLSGCSAFSRKAEVTPEPEVKTVTPTPMPRIDASPAKLLSGVETDRKVVALIFEGYTDDLTVEAIAGALQDRHVPSTFFVSGVTADEHGELLKKVAEMGFGIGNYGMSGAKKLERLPAYQNAEQFKKTQDLITRAAGIRPTYIRCNGTVYTEDVLRAVTAGGLEVAVEPSAYLNHRSFKTEADAGLYTQSVILGSIISVKLGQELDKDEFGEVEDELDERPAIDPSPGIRRDWEATDERFVDRPKMVGWLVDQLRKAGITLVSLDELEASRVTLLEKRRELNEEEKELLTYRKGALPLTEEPLSAGQFRAGSQEDFAGAVFVGDSVMAGVGDYVQWRRQINPSYLSDAVFLTENNMTVESLLAETNPIEDRLAEMGARSVWLCLGFTSPEGYRREAYLLNYRLLVYRIRQKNPGIRVIVMSIPPRLEGYAGVGNEQRFRLNQMLCGMAKMYGLGFVDAAYPLRDRTGALEASYCLDAVTYGRHLNDAGCETLLSFVQMHMPE